MEAVITRICHNRNPQTLYFGRAGQPVRCRVYDKTAEIKRSGKAYMKDYWMALGWDGKSTVVRVEFIVRGDFLKNTARLGAGSSELNLPRHLRGKDLRQLDDFIAAMPSIWKYLTHQWLRYCDRTDDSNPWRWPVAELWQTVQSAWPDAIPIIRVRPKANPGVEQAAAQLQGWFIRMSVLMLEKGVKIDAIDNMLALFMEWAWSEDCRQRFEEKRRQMGRDELSDSHFDAQVRRQMMLQGFGS